MLLGSGDFGPFDEQKYADHGDVKKFYHEAKSGINYIQS